MTITALVSPLKGYKKIKNLMKNDKTKTGKNTCFIVAIYYDI